MLKWTINSITSYFQVKPVQANIALKYFHSEIQRRHDLVNFDKEFPEGVIGAKYKNTINNYMEHQNFSKPTVNSIKKHLKDAERLKGFRVLH